MQVLLTCTHALSSVLDHGDAVLGPAPGRLVHPAAVMAPLILVQHRALVPDRVFPARRVTAARVGVRQQTSGQEAGS